MKKFTMYQILKLEEIYKNLSDFNYGFCEEAYKYYKGKAEAAREIIELIRKAEND